MCKKYYHNNDRENILLMRNERKNKNILQKIHSIYILRLPEIWICNIQIHKYDLK